MSLESPLEPTRQSTRKLPTAPAAAQTQLRVRGKDESGARRAPPSEAIQWPPDRAARTSWAPASLPRTAAVGATAGAAATTAATAEVDAYRLARRQLGLPQPAPAAAVALQHDDAAWEGAHNKRLARLAAAGGGGGGRRGGARGGGTSALVAGQPARDAKTGLLGQAYSCLPARPPPPRALTSSEPNLIFKSTTAPDLGGGTSTQRQTAPAVRCRGGAAGGRYGGCSRLPLPHPLGSPRLAGRSLLPDPGPLLPPGPRARRTSGHERARRAARRREAAGARPMRQRHLDSLPAAQQLPGGREGVGPAASQAGVGR
jgi:hypothetical protein